MVVYGNRFYFSLSRPKSDSEYFRIQRRIVKAFKDFPSVPLLVKEHSGTPTSFPLKEFVEDGKIANCRVLREEVSFAELLPLADLVVLDSPTMTFLETLAAEKPVLVFNNWYRWDAEALAQLRKAAVYRDDFEEFLEVLRDYLAQGRFAEARG